MIYTTSATNVLRAQYILSDSKIDLGVVDTKSFLGIRDILCKEVTVSANKYEPVCILTQDANTILDITFEPKGNTPQTYDLEVKKTNSLNYFSDFLPVYIDFEEDIIAVKGRSFNKDNTPKSEAMLFYVRNPDLTKDLYWGLNPSQYFNEWKETDITTVSIPVTAVVFDKDDNNSVYIRFTQTQTEAPSSSSSEDPSSGLDSLASINDQIRVNQTREGGFSAFKISMTTLTINSPEIYKDEANQIKLVFNSELGAAQTSIPLGKFFEVVDPTPVPPPADDDKTKWWVWVIIGLVVFLVVVGILLYFLTKNKDDQEEENDEYMTPDEKKKNGDEEDQ